MEQEELVNVWFWQVFVNNLLVEKSDFWVCSSSHIYEKMNPLAPPGPAKPKLPAEFTSIVDLTKIAGGKVFLTYAANHQ